MINRRYAISLIIQLETSRWFVLSSIIIPSSSRGLVLLVAVLLAGCCRGRMWPPRRCRGSVSRGAATVTWPASCSCQVARVSRWDTSYHLHPGGRYTARVTAPCCEIKDRMKQRVHTRVHNEPSRSFHNHEECPYKGLLLVESAYYRNWDANMKIITDRLL